MKLLYWKTFLTMCIGMFVITAAGAAGIILGFLNVIKMNAGLWFVAAVFEIMFIFSSIICFFMLQTEMQERRSRNDN